MTHSDITGRKRAHDAVKEALEQLQLITDNMSAAVERVSSDLRYVWVNPTFAALMGRAKEEIAGRRIIDVIGREVYETFRPHIEKVLRGEKGECEIQVKLPKAGRRWIHAVYVPTTGQDHNIDGWISVIADVTERHEAEERLRESEERFRNMADTAPVLIWGSGPDRDCTFFNQVWLEFTGRTLKQELGNGWAEGVHPDDLDRCLATYSSSFDARQRFQVEYRLRRADGAYRWLLDSGVPRFTAGGSFEGYIGSCIDVTDFKHAQERFRLVVEASPAAMVTVDAEGKIVLVNSRTEKLFGYRRQELVGQSVEILVPEPFRERHQTLRNEFLLKGAARHMGTIKDLYGRRKDGAQFPVEIGLDPIETEEGSCMLASIVDVSERKLAEEKLRESEKRFRATFFQAAVGIAQTTIDGHWLLLNDRFCEILGFSQDELRGKTFIDITHPDDREASLTAVRELLAGEISSWSPEKRYIRKDGSTVWAKVFVSLVRDRQNKPQYFIAVVEDITQRTQAERALQESRRELRALAARLFNAQEEEQRRISRQLHDDFSQRLALLAFDTRSIVLAPASDQITEALSNIHTRIVQMSEDVRRIAHQLHPSILEDLGLAPALREVCEEFSAREGIEATLEQETMPEALPIEMTSCLYWIAQEALHNISKHAHASHVRLVLNGTGEGVEIRILDDGAGFDPEASRRQGLGIISMKERVRIVQGEFSLHSQPGRGTEVTAFVPLPNAAEDISEPRAQVRVVPTESTIKRDMRGQT